MLCSLVEALDRRLAWLTDMELERLAKERVVDTSRGIQLLQSEQLELPDGDVLVGSTAQLVSDFDSCFCFFCSHSAQQRRLDFGKAAERRYGHVAVPIKRKLFVIGGATDTTQYPPSLVRILDLVSRKWTDLPRQSGHDVPTVLLGHAAVRVGSQIYVFAGYFNGLRGFPE